MGLFQNLKMAARACRGEELYSFAEFMNKFFINSTDWDRWRIYDVFFAQKKRTYLHATRNQEIFIVDSADNVMSRELFVSGSSQLDNVCEALDLIGKERNIDVKLKTFIDIGANIGMISIPVAARGRCKDVIAIEPTPSACRLLRANIALNGLEGKISVFEAALSDADGTVEFETSDAHTGDNRIFVATDVNAYNEADRNKVPVRAARFDSLFDELDMNNCLVSIVVQGFEGLVLSGGRKIVANKTPLVLEFWPYGIKRANTYGLLKDALSQYEKFHVLGARKSVAFQKFLPISELDRFHDSLPEAGADKGAYVSAYILVL